MKTKSAKPVEILTPSARRRLVLPKASPRIRAPGEATSIAICSAMVGEPYVTGQGEVSQPVRAGSDAAYRIPSRGLAV